MERAKISAQIIADRIEFTKSITVDANFLERNFGFLEGTKWNPELNLEVLQYQVESVSDLCDRAKKALSKYTFADDMNVMIVSHGAMLEAVKHALSDGLIPYEDRSVPIIQGNVFCCEKAFGQEPRFYNLF